jgi:hypothetical protein
MDKTIQMARESWIDVYGLGHDRAKFIDALKHFESLVRADERDKWMARAHTMILGEREACAKVCDDNATDLSEGDWDSACNNCACHIRARGQA